MPSQKPATDIGPLYVQWYFIVVVLSMACTVTLTAYLSQKGLDLYFCFDHASCLHEFLDPFRIPIQAAILHFTFLAAALAYHKLELARSQTSIQRSALIYQAYKDFRDTLF